MLRGRSREGAWIEISTVLVSPLLTFVAPVRERGLKFFCSYNKSCAFSRSREGAWIEMGLGRMPSVLADVAPVRERGLKWLSEDLI